MKVVVRDLEHDVAGRQIGSSALIADARVGARVSSPGVGDEALAPARALGKCRTADFST